MPWPGKLGSEEKEPIGRRSSEYGTSQKTTTDNEEKVICADFEKQVGRTQDFMLYYGSRKTRGVKIRNVYPKSPLAGKIRPQDQLIKEETKKNGQGMNGVQKTEDDPINLADEYAKQSKELQLKTEECEKLKFMRDWLRQELFEFKLTLIVTVDKSKKRRHNKQQVDDDLRTEILQLREEKKHIENEMEQYQQENTDKNNDIQQLQQENINKNNEIQQLQQEKSNKNNEIEQLQEEMQAVQEENDDLRLEIKNTESNFCESGSVVVSTEVIGRGSWGAVYIGDFYGTKVAVKNFYEIILSPHNKEILDREIAIASQCRHPNLLQFICATENDQHHLIIVTELMDMALRTLIEQHAIERSQLSNQEVKSISLDVARGLNYLHSKKPSPIIHRDVSSANVLLWIENGAVRRAKISDYGSANFMQVCNTPYPGAAVYAAPEASRAQHDPKIDVFSYGLLVCETSSCQLPHPDQVRRRGQINRIPNHGIKELVRRCTELDPRRRPTMQGVIESLQQME